VVKDTYILRDSTYYLQYKVVNSTTQLFYSLCHVGISVQEYDHGRWIRKAYDM